MITVERVCKMYDKQKALDNINFSVQQGEIIGLLGPNGAGKSTLMKILAGYITPDSGKVCINGFELSKHSLEARRTIGYLPEHNPLYTDMYVREYLKFMGKLHKLGNSLSRRTNEVIEQTGIVSEQHKKIGQLSKGYRQRVGLAQALLHEPSVLILDEPTTGLDPNQIIEIRQLMSELGQKKIILFSTHIMQEVAAICTRIIIVNKGNIVADISTEYENEYTNIEEFFCKLTK